MNGETEPVVASHKAAHGGTHAIGRKHCVGFDRPAVREGQRDPIPIFGKVHDAPAEVKSFPIDFSAERPLKVRPMNSAKWSAETLPIGAPEADGMGCDPSAGSAVAVDKLSRFG